MPALSRFGPFSAIYLENRSPRKRKPGDLADDCDLLLSGMIDSLGLLDLVTAIQEHAAGN